MLLSSTLIPSGVCPKSLPVKKYQKSSRVVVRQAVENPSTRVNRRLLFAGSGLAALVLIQPAFADESNLPKGMKLHCKIVLFVE